MISPLRTSRIGLSTFLLSLSVIAELALVYLRGIGQGEEMDGLYDGGNISGTADIAADEHFLDEFRAVIASLFLIMDVHTR